MQTQIIGQTFYEFRTRAFYLEGELMSLHLVLFFRVSDRQWISLTVYEGTVEFILEDSEPQLTHVNEVGNEFSYPVNSVIELDHYIGCQIKGIWEYRLKADPDECIGIYFECDNKGFSILDDDGGLQFIEGKTNIPFMEYLTFSPAEKEQLACIKTF